MDRSRASFENARKIVPAPVVVKDGTSRSAFLAYGSTDFALAKAWIRSREEKKISPGRGLSPQPRYPFAHEIHDFVASHERVT